MFRLFKNLTKKNWIMIFLCIILVAFQVYLELKIPDYMSKITMLVQSNITSVDEIVKNGIYMLGCALLSLATSFALGYFAAVTASSFSCNLRDLVFNKVLNLSMEDVKKFAPSSLITRTTNDITQMEMLIGMGLQVLIKAPIMAVWAILKILNKGFEWTLVTGGCIVILLITIAIIITIVMPRFGLIQKLIDKLNGSTRENLTGVRVIRAFNAEKYMGDRFETANESLTKNQMFNRRCFAILSPMMNLIMHLLTIGIYFIGAFLIEKAALGDKITLFSNMIVFSSYGMQVIASFILLALIFMIVPRASVSAKRINEVLDEPLKILNGKFNKETDIKGEVEFKNVSFKYPDAEEYILNNISFKASKGQTIAFIGSTGSGKSTLINLIPRFYDATDGEVIIDGINIKEYNLETLYDKLGYISQKAVMFTGTVTSNVAYGQPKDKEIKNNVKKAIQVAQAEEFVLKMEDKYESHIARGGTNISGGQKQRLSIARAIAKDPEIYIFDDSFSALDYKTDATLRRELKEYTKDATTFIVAQRIGTIINADKIIVLDNGSIVGEGTHKELLKSCEVYKEIALSQLSKEELANA